MRFLSGGLQPLSKSMNHVQTIGCFREHGGIRHGEMEEVLNHQDSFWTQSAKTVLGTAWMNRHLQQWSQKHTTASLQHPQILLKGL